MDAISAEIQIALPADPKLLTTLIKYQLLLLLPLAFEMQPSACFRGTARLRRASPTVPCAADKKTAFLANKFLLFFFSFFSTCLGALFGYSPPGVRDGFLKKAWPATWSAQFFGGR